MQLVILTSKITVGASCELPWDRMYVDATGRKGASSRNLMQMIGRFRELADPNVPVVFKHVANGKPVFESYKSLYAKAMDDLKHRKRIMSDYTALLNFNPAFDQEKHMTLSPDWITELVAFGVVENEFMCPVWGLYTNARTKGFRVFADFGVTAEDDNLRETKKEVKDNDEAFEQNIHTYLHSHPAMENIIDECQQTASSQESNRWTKELETGAHTMKHWNEPCLNFEDWKFAKKHKNKIYNYAAVTKSKVGDERALLRKDVNRLIKNQWADLTIYQTMLQYKSIDDCLALLSVKNAIDFETEIPSGKFAEHEREIVGKCVDCAVAGRRRKRERMMDTSKPGKRAIESLRSELNNVFGIKLKQIRRGKNRSVFFKLENDERVHELAMSSDFLSNLSIDEVAEVETWTQKRSKKRKFL